MLYIFGKIFLSPLLYLLFRPIVYGRENLRVKGKAIFISNHRSIYDPIIIGLVSPRNIHFMGKQELFKSKIAAFFLRQFFVFPVNRHNADMLSLRNALKVLNEGKIFGIFPEGKRAVTDGLDKFEKGTAFLALRAGAPVVPIYIQPGGVKRLRAVMIVGRPIDVSGIAATTKKSALIDVVTDELADAVDSLRLELEEKCG